MRRNIALPHIGHSLLTVTLTISQNFVCFLHSWEFASILKIFLSDLSPDLLYYSCRFMRWDEAVHKRPLVIFAKRSVNKYHLWKNKALKGLNLQVRDLSTDLTKKPSI